MSCNCIICRHERGEVSDEYFKGYLTGAVKVQTEVLSKLKKLGFKTGSISGEDSIEKLMTCVKCDLDYYCCVLQEVEE